MISIGITIDTQDLFLDSIKSSTQSTNIKDMAASANMVFKEETKDETTSSPTLSKENLLTEVDMEVAPASVIIPPRVEVYENMTIEELAEKLNRNLGTDYIAGKGNLIATQCIEKGVDPYVAVAIMLHETGCKSTCSALARTCNNVGGQKGAPGCNGGSYKAYATLDEGIIGFIDNLSQNYYQRGLTTIEAIAPKYAASTAWPSKINWYVDQIRAN